MQVQGSTRRMGIALLAGIVVAACGGTDGAGSTEPTAGEAMEGESVFVIEAVDYDYPNMADTLPVGTELRLVNRSTAEAHEAVVFRIPDGEDRSITELLELDEEESDAIFEEAFAGVLVAMPEEEGFAPEGPVVLDEPGRYVIICFFPIGHDPAELEAAMSDPEAEGPPDLAGGPPHFTGGMVAEVTVEG